MNRKRKKKKKEGSNNKENTSKPEVLSQDEKKIKSDRKCERSSGRKIYQIQEKAKMDWFTVYINAYTHIFDPHTNYYSPQERKILIWTSKGKIIGIGAVIQEKKGNLYIGTLSIGAPAWKTKQLTEGDKILKIKSTPDTDPVNVVDILSSRSH